MEQEKPQQQKKQRPSDPRSKLKDYGKYSALAFQMGITIALGVWGGMKLDEYFGFKKFPVFTLSLSLLSIFAAVYFVVRDVLKK